MLVNGFLPISDIQRQEGVNASQNGASAAAGAAQGGDFSALLFLIFAAPGAHETSLTVDAEANFATMSSAGEMIKNSAPAPDAGPHDANDDAVSLPVGQLDPEVADVAAANFIAQSPATLNAAVVGVNLQSAARAGMSAESYRIANHSTNAWSIRNLNSGSPGASEGAALSINGQFGHSDAPGPIPSPGDVVNFSSAKTGGLSGNLVWAGTQAAPVNGPENRSGEQNALGGSIIEGKVLTIDDGNATRPSQVNLPWDAQATQGKQHSIESRDTQPLFRALSANVDESSVRSQYSNFAYDRVPSEALHSVGETNAPQPQLDQQAGFFQHREKAADELMQALFASARHNGAPFHVAGLTDHAARGDRPLAAPDWRPVIGQLTAEINGHIRIGKSDAVIQLDPPELGKLKIELRVDGDKVEARIITEHHESRTLIESHLPELRQALGENRLAQVEVRIDSGALDSAHGDGWQGMGQEANGDRQQAGDNRGAAALNADEHHPLGRHRAAREPGHVSMWA